MSPATSPAPATTDRESLRRELLRLIVNNETHRRDSGPSPGPGTRRIDASQSRDTESK
jgi:hypothetical protein